MSRNGSGTYSPPASSFPAVANTLIESTKFNNVINDIGSEITKSIANDGQTPVLANLPMSGFKHTGAGQASAAGEYVEYAQAVATYETQAHAAATYLSKVKIGQIVRAMNSASGSQAITGLGFTPKIIRFFGLIDGIGASCQSQTDGTSTHGSYFRSDTVTFNQSTSVANLITSSGNTQTVSLVSFDEDGFTLSWTKLGTPTGVAYLNWEAIA